MQPKRKILEISDLTKSFNGDFCLRIPYLEIKEHSGYGIVGPNGSGKTTLITVLGLVADCNCARKVYFGKELGRDVPLGIKRRMTVVSQQPYLFSGTVYSNMLYPLELRKMPEALSEERIGKALSAVGLSAKRKAKTNQLSGGERQRLSIARALALRPELLFLDEPTQNVDSFYIDILTALINEYKEKKYGTVIFATHDYALANALADEVILISEGRGIVIKPENVFYSTLHAGAGTVFIEPAAGVRIYCLTEKSGVRHAVIPATDIIVSDSAFASSARNRFKGFITKIIHNHTVRLSVNVGVELTAQITKESFQQMNLQAGNEVYLTFKASSVQVF